MSFISNNIVSNVIFLLIYSELFKVQKFKHEIEPLFLILFITML